MTTLHDPKVGVCSWLVEVWVMIAGREDDILEKIDLTDREKK